MPTGPSCGVLSQKPTAPKKTGSRGPTLCEKCCLSFVSQNPAPQLSGCRDGCGTTGAFPRVCPFSGRIRRTWPRTAGLYRLAKTPSSAASRHPGKGGSLQPLVRQVRYYSVRGECASQSRIDGNPKERFGGRRVMRRNRGLQASRRCAKPRCTKRRLPKERRSAFPCWSLASQQIVADGFPSCRSQGASGRISLVSGPLIGGALTGCLLICGLAGVIFQQPVHHWHLGYSNRSTVCGHDCFQSLRQQLWIAGFAIL